MAARPNLLFVFADQWRAQAFGHEGDPNVKTPNIDAFAAGNVRFTNAVSGCPVCSPYRASLMTGQYPSTHGMFVNDQCLAETADATFLAEAFGAAGYETAYIGKWHIDGHGRSAYVPPERRLGFETWLGCECSHDYNDGFYYADGPERRQWQGYDAEAQTEAASDYIRRRGDGSRPFALFLSWGPPHNPYGTAPERFGELYRPEEIVLRGNVPPDWEEYARTSLAGYYAHCTALDECFGRLLAALTEAGLDGDTIVVFTSDHGDMLGSQGEDKKQKPWEESLRVPLIVRDPLSAAPGLREVATVIDAPDLMPTLLSLCGAGVPSSVEGSDLSAAIRDGERIETDGALIGCYFAFSEWSYAREGRDYRGLRTERHTYVSDHDGPWLLYDNGADPLQMVNLVNDPGSAKVRDELGGVLARKLAERGDEFLPGPELTRRHGVRMTENGDIFYE